MISLKNLTLSLVLGATLCLSLNPGYHQQEDEPRNIGREPIEFQTHTLKVKELSSLPLHLLKRGERILDSDSSSSCGSGSHKICKRIHNECPGEPNTFNRTLFLAVTGRNPQCASDETLDELGDALEDAYNALNARLCDPLFRRIVDVVFEVLEKPSAGECDETRRDLQETAGGTTTIYKGTVIFDCNCATEDVTAFGDAFIRRLQIRDRNDPYLHDVNFRRALKDYQDNCVCTVAEPEFRGPTPIELADAFTNEVENRNITEVGIISDVSDGCPSLEEHFTTILVVTLEGSDPGCADLFELNALASAFVQLYNELIEEFCDPLFREITSAEFSLSQAALEECQNHRRDVEGSISTTKESTVPLHVEFDCRLCDEGELVHDAFRRDLFAEEVVLAAARRDTPRRLQGSYFDTCVCTSDSPLGRAPTFQELVSGFNEVLSILSSAGITKVTNIKFE